LQTDLKLYALKDFLKNEIATVDNVNNRLRIEAIADIFNRIEQYRFIPEYFLTVDFHQVYKSAGQLVEHVGHIDRVIKTFIHRNKWWSGLEN
jgi:hypothetical protein